MKEKMNEAELKKIKDMVENPTKKENLQKYQEYRYETEGDNENKKTGKMISTILFCSIIVILLFFNLTTAFVKVDGSSMESTFHDGDLFFVKKHINPKRGEVVVFKQDMSGVGGEGNELLIKRVVATDGDTVVISDGKVYINNEEVADAAAVKDESTGKLVISDEDVTFNLTEGQYFVLGDNRDMGKSVDSRYFGIIDESQIKGVLTEHAEELTQSGEYFETLFPNFIN